MPQDIWKNPGWTPTEAPRIPGAPATLDHTLPVRIGYVVIGIACALAGNLGNAFVTANLTTIQGNLHLTPVEGQWLIGGYAMMNCWANLLLFKFRIQFGIRFFAQLSLVAYAVLCIFQVFVHDFPTALLTRAASGLAAAPLFGMTSLYFIQAAGQARLFKAAMVGLTMPQLMIPLAFLMVPARNDLGTPELPYLFEAGVALIALALVVAFPLPYSARVRVFSRGDVVALALFVPGLALLAAVLAQSSTQWPLDQPWIGGALAGAIVLIVAGLAWEYGRPDPLLFVRWLATGDVLFFIVGALVVRFLTAEQTVGAIGFLRTVGVGPDQFFDLYLIIFVASLAGLFTMMAVAAPTTIFWCILAAILLIVLGALLDRDVTPLDRPQNFYVSQGIIAFASALFVGPLLLTGIQKVIRDGAQNVVSFFAVFAFTQSISTLLGSAILTGVQLVNAHAASGVLSAQVQGNDPIVQQQLAAGAQALAGQITDPALRAAEAVATLGQEATLNAVAIAYGDMFTLIGGIAALYTGVMAIRLAYARRQQRNAA